MGAADSDPPFKKLRNRPKSCILPPFSTFLIPIRHLKNMRIGIRITHLLLTLL
jgi:hypothetical protein